MYFYPTPVPSLLGLAAHWVHLNLRSRNLDNMTLLSAVTRNLNVAKKIFKKGS